ncbi:MAG TPA: glycosyltransferase family 61 protein [Cytophagaceae bacterium]|jgi:capsular polysaccharide biosynthesis protein
MINLKDYQQQPLSNHNKHHLNVDALDDDHKHAIVPRLTFVEYDNAFLTPINHLYIKGVYVASGLITTFDDKRLSLFKKWYLFIKFKLFYKSQKHLGIFIWTYDHWSTNYYHWMCETLPRILKLAKNFAQATVILPESFKNYSYIEKSLGILDINPLWITADASHSFQKLVTTDTNPRWGNVIPELQIALKNELFSKLDIPADAPGIKKIYISRANASYRKITNEQSIIGVLSKLGYEILYTEKLDFEEQIRKFSKAKIIIALHGAGLTNLMFLPKEAFAVEIRHQDWTVNPLCFWRLANIFDVKWQYLTFASLRHTNFSDLTIDLKAFESFINKFEDDAR